MKQTTPLFLFSTLALAAAQTLAQTAPAPAQPAQPTSSDGGEGMSITVVARRVEERIIDVPLTIKALTARDLQERSIANVTDLSLFNPGLSYSPDFGRTQERPVIRGISALRPEAPQPVSVFIDGLFMRDGTLGLALDDAQRVEVIKGPQSALYGRATYVGAINYITEKPGNDMKGRFTLTYAQAGERTLFGAVTVPLIKDKLSARVRVRSYDFGGQYTNSLTGNKIGNESTNGGGLLVNFTPNDRFQALLALDYAADRDGLFAATARTVPTQAGGVVTSQNNSTNVANGATCNGRTINIVGNNAAGLPDASVPPTAAARLNGWPCGASNFSGTFVSRNEADLANYTDPATGINYGNIAGLDRRISRTGLTLNYEFGNGYTLTSQTGLTEQRANLAADQSYSGVRFAITGASWTSYNRDELRYISQELRLSSPENQPLTWLVGGFWYEEKSKGQGSGVITRANPAAPVLADPLRPSPQRTVTNMAPFARVQYQFNKDFRVSVEGRYNREEIELGGGSLGTATVTTGACVAGQACFLRGTQTFTDFSPRITADFKPNKDSLVYLQFATGSKSGGFNENAGLPAANFTYKGEKVKSAELGWKSTFMANRIGVSAALFRNDIEDLQLSNISTVQNPVTGALTTTTIVNNVGKARTQGLELDFSARLASWLTLNLNYAYTDAKSLEGTEITNGTVFGGNMSVAGFTLPRSPKQSAAGSLAVDAPLGAGGLRVFSRMDVVHQSRRYAEIQNMIWADPFTKVNVSAGLRGKDWRVTLWVKNATNEDASLNGFRYLDPVTFRRSAVDFLPRLRQAGLTVNYDF